MKVSVCMATYNGSKYIAEQIRSILVQLGKDDEVIISDDGSTDETVAIIRGFTDPRIKLVFNNSSKKGYTPNFENALKQAAGDYIFLSDQDDVWLPGKYKKVITALKESDLVVTNSKVTDEYLNVTNPSFFTIYNSGPGILKNIACSTYYGCCMAFNRRVLIYAQPFPEYKDTGIDLWLGLVAEIVGKVTFIEEPCLLWRRSESATTRLGSIFTRSKRPLHLKILKRGMGLYNISKLAFRYRILEWKKNQK